MKKSFLHAVLLLLIINVNFVFAQKIKSKTRIVSGKPVIVTVRTNSADPSAKFAPDVKRRYDSFILAWNTIDDYYFDSTFSGLNWEDVKKEFEPRVLAAKTDAEFHKLLQEMINRLKHSHLAVISPEVFKEVENAKLASKKREAELREKISSSPQPSEEDKAEELQLELEGDARYGIGVDLRLIDDQFVITRVEKNSSGEYAGLKTGFIISKINDVSLKDLLFKIRLYNTDNKDIAKFVSFQIIEYFLNGERDSAVNLEYLDQTNQPKQLKVAREWLKGKAISIGKNYPDQYLRFQTDSLNGQTGYVKFNVFALPVIADFCTALSQFKDKKAIVIDLRGNIGGVLGTMSALGGMLTENQIDLGTQFYKIGSENLTAFKTVKNYHGRIVVLVDNLTVSAAEIFAAALQENNRALVVGQKTAGEALPSVSISLPTGAVLTYPIANFKTHKGTLIEGNGVEPNFQVALDRQSLLANKDSQLETALELIGENTAFPSRTDVQPADSIRTINSGQPPPPAKIASKTAAGELKLTAPAPIVSAPPANQKDEKAVQIINDFINSIGGAENLVKINSYHLSGKTKLSLRGTNTDADIDIYLQKPDKFAQILNTEVIGEIREIYTGQSHYLQTDYGLTTELPDFGDISKVETLSAIYNLLDKDYLKSLKYLGAFEVDGKKKYVIQGQTKLGLPLGLSFDVATKKMTSYVSGYTEIKYDDYRPVGGLNLPFKIDLGSFERIAVTSYELNKAIEPANFEKKENCFDRPE